MRKPIVIAILVMVLLGLGPVRRAGAESVWDTGDRAGSVSLERRTFVVGGLGLWSDPASLFATAWGIGGGVLFPVNSWAVVPRLDVEGGGADNSSAWMARGTVGGRLPTIEFNGRHTYLEGGLGAAYCEHHETSAYTYTTPGFGAAPSDNRSFVTPCLVLSSGLTSEPLERPMFILETSVILSSHKDGPTVLMFRMGLGF